MSYSRITQARLPLNAGIGHKEVSSIFKIGWFVKDTLVYTEC